MAVSESDGLTVEKAAEWFANARSEVEVAAATLAVDTRQLASTLLLAVIGRERSLFAQVGDGAIVTSDGIACDVVFWPDRGEYANETVFLTSEQWQGAFRGQVTGRVDELAAITDGLQPVALHYATESAHGPFFLPMLAQLRQAEDSQSLSVPLKTYLQSEALRKRTDDDLTLLLATRLGEPGRGA